MKQFFKRYEMPFFFVLTYLLSWWAVPVMDGALIPHGPMFAAVIVISVTVGRRGLREYWKQLTHWRAGWWYLLGPLVIVGYTGIAFALNLVAGASLAEPLHWLAAGTLVQLLFLGGQWEEPGWTGYALPKLQERFGSLWIAALVLGVFRALWHLPLFVFGKMYWFDIFVFSFAFQIIIAWLYQRSGRSIAAVMVFHFVSNFLGATLSLAFAGAERLMFYALFMLVAVVCALVIVAFSRFDVRHEATIEHHLG